MQCVSSSYCDPSAPAPRACFYVTDSHYSPISFLYEWLYKFMYNRNIKVLNEDSTFQKEWHWQCHIVWFHIATFVCVFENKFDTYTLFSCTYFKRGFKISQFGNINVTYTLSSLAGCEVDKVLTVCLSQCAVDVWIFGKHYDWYTTHC